MGRLILTLGCLTLVMACCGTADAQQRRAPRRPMYQTRSPISPYATLFRGDNGGLNSYYNATLPRLNMDSYIRQSEYEFAAQGQLIDQRSLQLQQEMMTLDMGVDAPVSGLQLRPTTSSGRMRRPAGTFLNTSNYFPNGSTAGGSQIRLR